MAKRRAPRFLMLVNEAKERIREAEVHDVKRGLGAKENFFLVDTREESEWARGHLPGAIDQSKGVIERDIEGRMPEKDATIALYCAGGFRSALAAKNLQKMAYQNVISMDGGWRGRVEAGYPTARD